ncbi:MAG: DNRLRE domain-containing protein, partial [Deltaproteobacteria bacterium]
TTFEETGLTNDTAYYYVVNAVNSKGESANSNEACVIPSAGETSIILYPTADAYIRDGQYGDTNYGKAENLDVNYTPGRTGKNCQTYLMYDLSGIKSTPKTAEFVVSGRNITNTKRIEVDIYKVTDDTWKEDVITWNNSPTCGWTYEIFYVDSTYKTSVADITTFTNEEYKGDKKLSVLLDAGTTKSTASLCSREGKDTPFLRITY